MKKLQNQETEINDFVGDFNTWQTLTDDSFRAITYPQIRQAPDDLRKVQDHERRVKLNEELLKQIDEKLKIKQKLEREERQKYREVL